MVYNRYGYTEEINDKLYTVGNLYLIKDQDNNTIEATLILFKHESIWGIDPRFFMPEAIIFGIGEEARKRIGQGRLPDEKDMIQINKEDYRDRILEEVLNRARKEPDWHYSRSLRREREELIEELNPTTRFGTRIHRGDFFENE